MSILFDIPSCVDGRGFKTKHRAEGRLCAPSGRAIGVMCSACAEIVIDEYKRKLGQDWSFVRDESWQLRE